jgi:glycosyltransferase involved in cell wall biosynthesis
VSSISIITPTLNAEAYVAECLASVQGQSVPEVEHVLVDGGSTDRTAEIARQHIGVRWVERPDLKQAAAINVGFRLAAGEVVAWLNADDLYAPGALALAGEEFQRDPSLDVLYGDCEVIGPDGRNLWWERPGAYDFRRMLRRGNYLAQPAVFLRRRLLDDVGYLDENLEYAMDYDLWLRLRGRRLRYVARPLARFRWHAASKSASGQLRGWNEFLLIVRRYGGGWTPEIAWAYARCLVTVARIRVGQVVTGSTGLRPLTRGTV